VSIDFPLLWRQTAFGVVSDPKIPVTIPTLAGARSYYFLVDTGADFSLAPRSVAIDVGLDWNRLPHAAITGVEQGTLQARLGQMPLRIRGIDLSVRCLFLGMPNTDFILGRADFLDRFVLTIDQPRRRIILDEVDP
jgi:predicted aspartyl protease